MFKNLFFILLFLFVSYNFSYATGLSLNIEGGTSKEVYYNENVSLNAIATFGESCSSTGITWTKPGAGFPFPVPIILGTGPNLTTSFTSNTNITVTANCDGVSEVTFVFITIKDPIVNAGANTSYNSGEIVNLSGSIIGTDPGCTVFNYQWEQLSGPEVLINNSTQNEFNSSTYNNANFVFPDTTENIVLKLKVSPQSCYHAGNTYSGTVTYSKNSPVNSGGGRSWNSRMREEAELLFYNTGSIEKISIKLEEPKINSPFMYFNWNNIGGDGQVNYILEYSTGSSFELYKEFKTTNFGYNFIEFDLDKDSLVHYFRAKVCYIGKCSPYSKVIKYYNEDYLTLSCKKDKKFVDFDDIFLGEDFLSDDIFKVKCKNCKRNK